jgi:hypothetical protein
MSRPRIKGGTPPRNYQHIPPAGPIEDGLLRFSFKHLHLHGPKFRVADCKDGYLERLLERLRDLCLMKIKEFRTTRSNALRSHAIDFSESTEPNGFSHLNEQLRTEQAWQFEITSNEHGRIHGLLIDDTFYAAWVDPKHKLYA